MPRDIDGFEVPDPGINSPFEHLRIELADLAFDLEQHGRRDAADVVMQIHARVRELAGDDEEATDRSILSP